MAITFVVGASLGTGGSGSAVTTAVDTTGANLIVLSVGWVSSSTVVVSDNKGNTWTACTKYNDGSSQDTNQLFYCVNPTVGSGHTFTTTLSGAYSSIAMASFKGVLTSSPLDQQNGSGNSSATTKQAGSVTPGQNNELVIAGLMYGVSNASTIDSSYNKAGGNGLNGGVSYGCSIAYLIQTTAGATNPTWSSNGSAAQMVAALATFKAALSGLFVPCNMDGIGAGGRFFGGLN